LKKKNTLLIEFRNNVYVLEVNGKEAGFLYAPDTLDDIQIPLGVTEHMKYSGRVSVTVDENHTFVQDILQSTFQLSANVFETNGLYIQPGLTTENPELPQVTCGNQTELVIYFVEEGNMTYENNCFTVPIFSGYDATRFTEAIGYSYYGVK